ncbi:MAG TPA: hypothetical protein VEZ47_06075 [Gemmatirosa sp.]|nr:hypothetical protein [Gemmatirosa sp.]
MLPPAVDPALGARRLALLVGLALVVAAPPACARAQAADGVAAGPAATSFRTFWTAFRSAALAGDTVRVAALTRFPFRTRGDMDDDSVRRHARRAFPALFVERALTVDPGLSIEPETMRDLIARTIVPGDGVVHADGRRARVGAFVFERVAVSVGAPRRARRARAWRFVQAYLPDERD